MASLRMHAPSDLQHMRTDKQVNLPGTKHVSRQVVPLATGAMGQSREALL